VAYSYTATVEQDGPGQYVVVVEEVDCGPNDEAIIDGAPLVGNCVRATCVRQGGSATTVQPILGRSPDPPGTGITRVIVEESEPVPLADTSGTATYRDATAVPAGVVDARGRQIQGARIYHRSRPDAGADNVIRTEYHIKAGW